MAVCEELQVVAMREVVIGPQTPIRVYMGIWGPMTQSAMVGQPDAWTVLDRPPPAPTGQPDG